MRQECIIQYHKLINRRTQNETGMYYTIPQAYQQKGTEGDRNVLYNTTSLSTEGHGMRQECIIQYHKLINRRAQKETGMYYTIPQAYQQKDTEGDRNVLYNTTSLSTEGHGMRQECIIQYHKLINRRAQETGMYYTISQAYQQKGTEGDRNVLYNTTSLSTEGHRRRQECIIQYHKLINRRTHKETGMYYTIPQAYQQKDTE